MDARLPAIDASASGNDDLFVYGTPAGLTQLAGSGMDSADNVTVPNADMESENYRGRNLTTGPTIDPRGFQDGSHGGLPAAESEPAPTSLAEPIEETVNSSSGIAAQQAQDTSSTVFKCNTCKFPMSFDTQEELESHVCHGRHFEYPALELDEHITRVCMDFSEILWAILQHIETLRERFEENPSDWVEHELNRNKARYQRLTEEYLCHILYHLQSRERPAVPADRLHAVLSTLDCELGIWQEARFGYRSKLPSLASLYYEERVYELAQAAVDIILHTFLAWISHNLNPHA